jgi:hypothetical protein
MQFLFSCSFSKQIVRGKTLSRRRLRVNSVCISSLLWIELKVGSCVQVPGISKWFFLDVKQCLWMDSSVSFRNWGLLQKRMPRTPGRGVSKEDPEYLEKRAKNNEAIRRSREKARNKQKETEVSLVRTSRTQWAQKIRKREGGRGGNAGIYITIFLIFNT